MKSYSVSGVCACLGFLLFLEGHEAQQRLPPGVNPQHYQDQQYNPNIHHQQQQFQGHPPPPQQQQQYQHVQPGAGVPQQVNVQQQQQHVPQQQQHVPQQQQQHVPHQQQGGHHAGHHGQGQPLLDTSNLSKEREHIQEHMDVPIDTSKMSEHELQFHYFKMHDADNNNKLDGCELVKSLIHWHDASNHDHRGGMPVPEPKVFTDQELVNMIDPILQNDDKNGDGFIDYGEFSLAQAAAAQKTTTQQH